MEFLSKREFHYLILKGILEEFKRDNRWYVLVTIYGSWRGDGGFQSLCYVYGVCRGGVIQLKFTAIKRK